MFRHIQIMGCESINVHARLFSNKAKRIISLSEGESQPNFFIAAEDIKNANLPSNVHELLEKSKTLPTYKKIGLCEAIQKKIWVSKKKTILPIMISL